MAPRQTLLAFPMSGQTVWILDDHKAARLALVEVLREQPGFEVCHGPASAELAEIDATQAQPDTLLIDTDTVSGDGLALCRRLLGACPQTALFVLTARPLGSRSKRSLVGVRGFLLKDLQVQRLIEVVCTNPTDTGWKET